MSRAPLHPDLRRFKHAESLLDESIAQTFPASDPVAAAQPGSVVSRVYASSEAGGRHVAPAKVFVLVALAVGALGWAMMRAARNRSAERGAGR